jgi:hypothetical protein
MVTNSPADMPERCVTGTRASICLAASLVRSWRCLARQTTHWVRRQDEHALCLLRLCQV